MDMNKAVEIVERVCAEYRGTLAEHRLIQEAVASIKQEETPVTKDEQQ